MEIGLYAAQKIATEVSQEKSPLPVERNVDKFVRTWMV